MARTGTRVRFVTLAGAALALVVTQVAVPGAHAANGDVATFGSDARGQLGNGSAGSSHVPGTVLTGASDVAGGREHVLALKGDGTVWAWGADSFGQLGNGAPFASVQAPVRVLTAARAVTTGHLHSLALMGDGGVRAWGNNDHGQVGPAGGEASRVAAPLGVTGLPGPATRVSAGRAHSIALVGGSVYTWGDNSFGQLGYGSADTRRHATPAKVPGLPRIVFVAGGRDSTYAIDANANLYAWGRNTYGQVGNGTSKTVLTPVRVLTGAKQVEAGADHTVALKADGTVWSWGRNNYGQLGYSGSLNRLRPTRVTAVPTAAKAYVGRDHTIALTAGGVYTWGRNDGGQLGSSPSQPWRSTPTRVSGLAGGRDAGGGELYSVVLK